MSTRLLIGLFSFVPLSLYGYNKIYVKEKFLSSLEQLNEFKFTDQNFAE